MVVDNFEIVEKILNFEPPTRNESIYYQIDLIERKKTESRQPDAKIPLDASHLFILRTGSNG